MLINFTYKAQQNLVPNGSFEEYDSCPNFLDELYKCKYWRNPSVFSSPDYFNSCEINNTLSVPKNIFGYQNSFNGNAYAGIVLHGGTDFKNYREYLIVRLTKTLTKDKSYNFSLNLSLADSAHFGTSDIEFGFYNDTIGIDKNILTPNYIIHPNDDILTDKINWHKITVDFTAMGNENYLVIGNFKNDSNSLLSPNLGGGVFDRDKIAYYYVDSVQLFENSDLTLSITMFDNNLITNNGDSFNDSFDFSKYNLLTIDFQVYNRWGNLVFATKNLNSKWYGTNQKNEKLPTGTYYYVLEAIEHETKITKHNFVQIIN